MAASGPAIAGQTGSGSALQAVGYIFGLFAGAATILYIAGGAVLALRFWYHQLPVELPISELPQTLLVTIALTEVLLPSAVVAVGYLTLRVVAWPHDGLFRWFVVTKVDQEQNAQWYLSRAIAVAGLVAVALSAVMIWYRYHGGKTWNLPYWIAGWIGCLLVAIVIWRTNMLLHQQHPDADWRKPIAVVKVTVLVGIAALPIWVVNGGTSALPPARGCGPNGTSEVAVGWLLGETSDRIYFGGISPDNGPYVVWVPSRAVERLVVGTEDKPAAELSC